MNGERFMGMCVRIATDHTTLDATKNYTLPEEYNELTTNIVKQLKPKVARFETLTISYIQNVFDDLDYVESALEEKTEDGEIPDGLLCYLAYYLYGVGFNDLASEEQAIIKVLACYIIISN